MTLGSLWDDIGVTLGRLWGHFGMTLGSLWDDFGVFHGHSGVILRASRVTLRCCEDQLAVKKDVFVTKWVGKGRNAEILIPIDAARPGDLENHGFGQLWKI